MSSQTDYVKRLLEQRIRENAIDDQDIAVADFIRRCWYVDDGGTSVRSHDEADNLIAGTNKGLGRIKMYVKGWTVSFQPPASDVSDDGVSVGFAGMRWYPEIDSFSLRIQKLHFGKKRRGKYPDNLKKYDGSFGSL